MSDKKSEIIAATLGHEGGYVNDPTDRGGETNYGITLKTARKFGYEGPMKEIPYPLVYKIYEEGYYKPAKIDEVIKASGGFKMLAERVYDAGVNHGIIQAGKFLQRALNDLERTNPLVDDGIVGEKTISKLRNIVVSNNDKRTGSGLILNTIKNLIMAQQYQLYKGMAEKDPKQAKYFKGWFLRFSKGKLFF